MTTLYSFPFSLPCYRTRLAVGLLAHPVNVIENITGWMSRFENLAGYLKPVKMSGN
ncbi:hypothetical protein [Neptunomonas antarctica]|uniref:Uncharacterized protein n=1 Tax=Neptunomonas antarctica TaxID=619304 RepID=A0A1N7LHM9_9GAMM|nr:hypothetical protein [Neptunomonas antarctica]SIS73271.1 hypothetical protein SAMN05421760_10435 [Neptunomonas antarctica]